MAPISCRRAALRKARRKARLWLRARRKPIHLPRMMAQEKRLAIARIPRTVRAIDPLARVIAATADVQSSTRTMAAEAGAKAFLAKPFTAGDVHAVVETALAGDAA